MDVAHDAFKEYRVATFYCDKVVQALPIALGIQYIPPHRAGLGVKAKILKWEARRNGSCLAMLSIPVKT